MAAFVYPPSASLAGPATMAAAWVLTGCRARQLDETPLKFEAIPDA